MLGASVDQTVPRLMVGDEHRIRQVLSNYISNAVKFTDHGMVDVSLHVDPAAEAADKMLLHVSVTDTGIGIPEDRMDRLFKTFSQVDASTTRKYGGTGLGLAIVKRLADLMGGKAWAESVVGQGSVFHFTALVGTTALKSPTREPMQSAYPELDHSMRILLAEDTESNQTLIQATLKRMGLTADVVSDGLQAVSSGGRGGRGRHALRRGADGRADAGDGRDRGHESDPGSASRAPAATHHRGHGRCAGRRPRTVHTRGDGRLPVKAFQAHAICCSAHAGVGMD